MARRADQYLKKVLILQTAFIGDVVLATGLVRTIAHVIPEAEIHFITIPASRQLLDTLPQLKKVWVYDKKGEQSGILNLIKFSSQLRQEQFDAALIPHRSFRSALIMFLAGIPRRIGFDRSMARLLYTDHMPYRITTHELERNLMLADALMEEKPELELPQVVSSEDDIQRVDRWFGDNDIAETDRLVCLAPGSVWPTKRWPVEYWIELINKLYQEGIKPILIGGPEDRGLTPLIDEGVEDGLLNAIDVFSLRQSAEIIRRGDLLITNDSAPTHIGVAVRTPVLTLFGSTSPVFGFYPYGKMNRILEIENLDCRPCTDHGKRKCPLGHYKCMRDLKPEIVVKTVMEMLDAVNKD